MALSVARLSSEKNNVASRQVCRVFSHQSVFSIIFHRHSCGMLNSSSKICSRTWNSLFCAPKNRTTAYLRSVAGRHCAGQNMFTDGFRSPKYCLFTMDRRNFHSRQCMQSDRLRQETQPRSLGLEILAWNVWFGYRLRRRRLGLEGPRTVWRLVSENSVVQARVHYSDFLETSSRRLEFVSRISLLWNRALSNTTHAEPK
jgi:hypothetical protein